MNLEQLVSLDARKARYIYNPFEIKSKEEDEEGRKRELKTKRTFSIFQVQ